MVATHEEGRRTGDRRARVQREADTWMDRGGRIGLAAQGVLYGLVAILALDIAGGHQDQADQRGAIAAVADRPFGRWLLLTLTVGLAVYAVWRLVLAARGLPGDDRDAQSLARRFADLCRGIVYGGFTILAARVVFASDPHTERRDGNNVTGTEQRRAVAHVLDIPGGELLVLVAGAVVIVIGVWHVSQVVTRRFVRDLDFARRSETTRALVTALGSAGYAARGIVFGMVGWFLIESALDHDPNHTGGFDLALKRLAASDHGPGLLRLVAVGLLLFGVYRCCDAWLRDRRELTRP